MAGNSGVDRSMVADLERIRAGLENPEQGLPDPVFDFIRQVTPLINVDLLIRRDDRTLLAWREDEYHTGWHIPGGIIRMRESLKARIDLVALNELGAIVESEPAPCAIAELRDYARGHFISLLYRCRLVTELDASRMSSAEQKPRHGELCWIRGVPQEFYPAQRFYAEWLRGAI